MAAAMSAYCGLCNKAVNQIAEDCCGSLEDKSSAEYSKFKKGPDGLGCWYLEHRALIIASTVLMYLCSLMFVAPWWYTLQLKYELSKEVRD